MKSCPSGNKSQSPVRARAMAGAAVTFLLPAVLAGPAAAQGPTPAPPSYPYAQAPQQPRPQQPYPQQPPAYPQQPPAYPQQPAPAPQPYPQQQYPQQPYPQQPPAYPQQPQQPYPQQPQPYPQQPQPQAPPPAPAPAPEPAPPDPDLPAVGRGFYTQPARSYTLPPEPETRLDRRGMVIEVIGGSGGVFDAEDGVFGIGYGVAIGGALNPTFTALFDYSSLTFIEAGGARANHAIFSGAIQAFIGKRLWAKAGLGMAQLTLGNSWGFSLEADERALAGIAAVGVEVYQMQPNFAIDLQLRAAGGHYSRHGNIINGALLIGFNWY